MKEDTSLKLNEMMQYLTMLEAIFVQTCTMKNFNETLATPCMLTFFAVSPASSMLREEKQYLLPG